MCYLDLKYRIVRNNSVRYLLGWYGTSQVGWYDTGAYEKIFVFNGDRTYRYRQCCGCGMFILDPGSDFFRPGTRIQGLQDPGIPDPDSQQEFNLKNCF